MNAYPPSVPDRRSEEEQAAEDALVPVVLAAFFGGTAGLAAAGGILGAFACYGLARVLHREYQYRMRRGYYGCERRREEAADVDGAGPLKTYFGVVLPIMKPTVISVAILETMWIWNDYLLPYLILDGEYRTIPIHMQFLNGSYGQTDNGAIMALVVLSIIPIVAFYFACQKYIIEGVVSGAVKG